MCKRKDNRSPQPTPSPPKKNSLTFSTLSRHLVITLGHSRSSGSFHLLLSIFQNMGMIPPPPHTQTFQILDVKAPSLLACPKKTLLWQQLRCHVPMGPYGPENMAGWGELSIPSLRCPHSNPSPNPFLPLPSPLPGPPSDLTHTHTHTHTR